MQCMARSWSKIPPAGLHRCVTRRWNACSFSRVPRSPLSPPCCSGSRAGSPIASAARARPRSRLARDLRRDARRAGLRRGLPAWVRPACDRAGATERPGDSARRARPARADARQAGRERRGFRCAGHAGARAARARKRPRVVTRRKRGPTAARSVARLVLRFDAIVAQHTVRRRAAPRARTVHCTADRGVSRRRVARGESAFGERRSVRGYAQARRRAHRIIRRLPRSAPLPAVYDLLVIGGGVNGAGIARDAAGRGLSVLLVEKNDLASATSSASSKLIHGGLRYLEQYELLPVDEKLTVRKNPAKNPAHMGCTRTLILTSLCTIR